MKIQRQTELPRFIVGALAAAGASAASGATVQISFANNVVSSVTGTTSFTADLTGDGENEGLRGSYAANRFAKLEYGIFARAGYARGTAVSGFAYVGSFIRGLQKNGPGGADTRGLVAFSFRDARSNAGAVTAGWLDIEARATVGVEYRVQIHRMIFDDSSTSLPTGLTSASTGIQEWSAVPEPSSLGLLALGAGGLLARRRRAMAA